MMKKIFVLILLALAMAGAASAESIYYEGWIFNGKFLNFEGTNYKISIASNGESLLLQHELGSYSLDLHECKMEGYKRLCYNLSSYDTEEKQYKAYFYIYNLEPGLKLTRTIGDNILAVGEEIDVVAIIENTGDVDAEDLTFEDDFPENIEITDTDRGEISGNTIRWIGDLDIGETETITYTIKSIGKVDQYTKASLTYFDGYEDTTIYSTSLRLYSSGILDIEMTSDNEEYEINELINITLDISNIAADDADIEELKIILPESTYLVEKDNSIRKIDDHTYSWSGELSSGESEELIFKIKAEKTGVFFIVLQGDYEYQREEYPIKDEKLGFLIHNEGIELTTSIDNTEYVNSNQVLNIILRAKNLNEFSDIKSIYIDTITDISEFSRESHGRIGFNTTDIILNKQIKVPDINEEKSYKIKFNVTYITQDDKQYSESIERTVIVRPAKTLKLEPVLSSTNVLEGTEVTVKAILTNPSINDVRNIFVAADIPDGLSVRGAQSKYIDLDAGESLTALEFKVVPGIVETKTPYDISFTAIYLFDGEEYTLSGESVLNVDRVVPRVSIEKSIPGGDVYEGELIKVSYIITNNEDVAVTDLVIIPTISQDFDTFSPKEYTISRLDPGEKINLEAETIRPKKQGTLSAERTRLFFNDLHQREFNTTSGKLAVSVKEADIQGPAVYIEIIPNTTEIEIGEKIGMIINLSNVGLERAVGKLGGESSEIIIPFYRNNELFREIIPDISGNYLIPRQEFHYEYLGQEVVAYSQEVEISVIDPKDPSPDGENSRNDGEDATDEDMGTEIGKKSFFTRLKEWFISVFYR